MVEMLVVLVLVSLLGTLVIQGTGFFLGRFATVKRVQSEAAQADLRDHWFASTVEAILPSRQETRRFVGDSTFFEGVTLQPLAAAAGRPLHVRWSIEGGRVLYSEHDAEPWTILGEQGSGLSFQYADSSGQWLKRWPIEGSREHIPRMVRLLSADGRTLWLAHFDLYPEPVPNYLEEF